MMQLMHFDPLKRRPDERAFKERLLKEQEEKERANAEQLSNPAAELKRKVEEEVDEYMKVNEIEKGDPLAWWREHRESFPKIAELARELLAVPASSAGAERVFKALSLVLSRKRRRLRDHRAEDLVFVHENREFFAPEIWALEQKRQQRKEQRKAMKAGDPSDDS